LLSEQVVDEGSLDRPVIVHELEQHRHVYCLSAVKVMWPIVTSSLRTSPAIRKAYSTDGLDYICMLSVGDAVERRPRRFC
jgi:hypothetical protein